MSLNLPGAVAGIGIDVIDIDRVKLAHQKHGDAFLDRVFTGDEIKFCSSKLNPFPSYAVRFAAKEAVFKALSQVGIRIVSWQDIAINQSSDGVPGLTVEGVTGYVFHLSMSHTTTLATAIVVIERIS
ncbi:MAG: holo-ACP synthase [Candidatus Zixiibacteriota bacterium]